MGFYTLINIARQCIRLGLVTVVCCIGLMLGTGSDALASTDLPDLDQNPVEQGLDQVAGAGTVNQIEGKVQEDLGRVQRQVDQATSQVEGAGKQVKGRAQQDIGRTQAALEDAADSAEEKADSWIDSVKAFFN